MELGEKRKNADEAMSEDELSELADALNESKQTIAALDPGVAMLMRHLNLRKNSELSKRESERVKGISPSISSEEADVIAGNDLLDAVIGMIQEDVPEESWDTLPADFGERLDHYLYGEVKV
jgi:hypothetical protein